jgi:hypothetical protein
MEKVIIDKLDSRIETKFIFSNLWKYHSFMCVNILSKRANEYFKN